MHLKWVHSHAMVTDGLTNSDRGPDMLLRTFTKRSRWRLVCDERLLNENKRAILGINIFEASHASTRRGCGFLLYNRVPWMSLPTRHTRRDACAHQGLVRVLGACCRMRAACTRDMTSPQPWRCAGEGIYVTGRLEGLPQRRAIGSRRV